MRNSKNQTFVNKIDLTIRKGPNYFSQSLFLCTFVIIKSFVIAIASTPSFPEIGQDFDRLVYVKLTEFRVM